MQENPLDKFMHYIMESYGSLSQPDFSFVGRMLETRPYGKLIKILRDYAPVEELPQEEEDVCFSYLLKGRQAIWKLDLSMIGPFGIFVRLSTQITPESFLHIESPDLNAFEKRLVGMLHDAGIRLLTAEELSLKIPMTLYNTPKEEVRLYQALFSDRELPWSHVEESGKNNDS